METFNTITLNGKRFSGRALRRLVEEKTAESVDPWEKEIYQFIGELISETDHIRAYTSGSTGKKKLITLPKMQLIESANRTRDYFSLKSSDRALLCLPAAYIAGKMMIVRAFVTGFDLIYVEPSARPLENLREAIDFCALTPHQLDCSIEDIRQNGMVKKIILGGAPVSVGLVSRIQDLPAQVFETFGMTETCSHIAVKPLNTENKSEYFTVLPGISVSVNKARCLVIEDRYAGRLETRDLVVLRKRSFKWLGRADNMINTGAIKIIPEEVEKDLDPFLACPFMISSVADKRLGEKLVILLEKTSITKRELKAYQSLFETVLCSFENPRSVYLIPEFVYTTSNKINRKETTGLMDDSRKHDL